MRWLLLASLPLFIHSCNRPAATEGRLAAIEANIKSLRQLAARDKETSFTAYFQQGDLQFIDEQPVEGGLVHNRYYFHQGELFYYRQLEQGRVNQQFVIDKKGQVKNAIPATLPEPEYARIAARANELKTASLARAGQVFDFPIMRTR